MTLSQLFRRIVPYVKPHRLLNIDKRVQTLAQG